MRDPFYRVHCADAKEYDMVIDFIRDNHKLIQHRTEAEREKFASDSVNSCIRGVIFGESGNYHSTGGCLAVRESHNPDSKSYKKVLVAVTNINHFTKSKV